MIVQKGGQVTKPIIVVKVPCKLLYVIQVKGFLIKCSTSWPYLISEFLVAYITIVASDWPRTIFTPKVFLFSIKTHDSESRGQEEAGRTRQTSELFTRSTALKFVNALNKPT